MPRRSRRYYIIRGRLYEIAVEELIRKAGFETDKSKLRSSGLTQISKRLTVHGRGSTYNADVVGLFSLPVPFTYPILLIGEMKYHNGKVSIKEAREFLGTYTDLSQYPRVNTKGREWKYSQTFNETRYSYAPVMFSANGFHKNPQALFYTHGIYFISYENSPIFSDIRRNLEGIIKQMKVKKMEKSDLTVFYNAHSLTDLNSLRAEVKKRNFVAKFGELLNLINNLNSYIGVLDNAIIVNVLSDKKLRNPSLIVRESYPKLLRNNFIQLRNTAKPNSAILGGFSVPSQFLENYIKHNAKKQKPCFRELVIYIMKEDHLFPVYLKLTEEGSTKIIQNFVLQTPVQP